MIKTTIVLFLASAALAVLPRTASAAAPLCPQKSVRFLVGFPPGGATDIFARLLAHGLSHYFKQQFVVDNRPGATGNIASDAMLAARPDGCTYLVVSAAFASNVPWSVKPGQDPLQQLAPVTRIATVHSVLTIHPSVPVTSVKSFTAFVRARPGEVAVGTAGAGSMAHLALELLRTRVSGLQMVHVPYKGLGPAVLDLVSGEISALFATTPTIAAHLQAGRLRAVAVASSQRAAALPTVPTFAESGYPGFEATAWNGVIAHAATSYDQVTRLQLAVAALLRSPELRDRLASQGADPVGDTPDEFRTYLRDEIEKWARVARQTGARRE